MDRKQLYQQIKAKKSFLCVGLDTDIGRLPHSLLSSPDPIFAFNRKIIDATQDLCIAYKLNTAFYESMGSQGWESLGKTIEYIPSEHFIIADAKRGDVEHVAAKYAETFFSHFKVDAVTINPYMGSDTIYPFLEYNEKWVIVVLLTSNPSGAEFQSFQSDEQQLYEHVLEHAQKWGTPDNLQFVTGATQADQLLDIRQQIPNHFLLVPGVGAQGGDLEKVAQNSINQQCGLIVNSSRSIIYAGEGEYFDNYAHDAAYQYQQKMKQLLEEYELL